MGSILNKSRVWSRVSFLVGLRTYQHLCRKHANFHGRSQLSVSFLRGLEKRNKWMLEKSPRFAPKFNSLPQYEHHTSILQRTVALNELSKASSALFLVFSEHTYLLTPRCRVLLEKLTGLQLVKKFPTFHGTRRFITALTSVRHLSLS